MNILCEPRKSRIRKLQSKGQKTGETEAPTVSESRFYAGLDNGGDLADNVTCLGRCGVYKTLDGLTIGYLSGHSNSKDDQNYAVQDNAHIKLKGKFMTS